MPREFGPKKPAGGKPVSRLGDLWRDATSGDRIKLPNWGLVSYMKTTTGWALDESRSFKSELEEDDHDILTDEDLDDIVWETDIADDRDFMEERLRRRILWADSILGSGVPPYQVARREILTAYYEMRELSVILRTNEPDIKQQADDTATTIADLLRVDNSDPLLLTLIWMTWLRDEYQSLWDYLRTNGLPTPR